MNNNELDNMNRIYTIGHSNYEIGKFIVTIQRKKAKRSKKRLDKVFL
jgi:hypothetical protein